ncbi:hypothetical protein Clacol_010445 [Clathrus columnatus]|uniref:Uncharacterized protein n=1 Tax=Clathrus columnatus TaxID=1419009 RepID=A0AAV5AW86_9AGAM|nr:hypothetical protein Clacol_010445 [Clathrus columnatus]
MTTVSSSSTKSTHLFLLAHPGLGHVKPLAVFACKLLIAHRRIRPLNSLIITLFVVGDLKVQTDKEIELCLQSQNEPLRENFHVISLGGKGSFIGETYQALAQNFEPFYNKLHNLSPIECATGREHTFKQRPNFYIADFFMLYFLNIIRKLNEQDRKGEIFPILTWNPCVIGPVMRVVGPEALGGIGNIEAKAKELAERTGKSLDEAEAEIDHPQNGEIIRIPGLPPMYDYEFFPQETNTPKEIVKIQLTMHKYAYTMVHEFDGLINASSVAFEPEACHATKAWYAERNKSCYIVGPLVPDDMLTDNDNELGRSVLSTKESEVMKFLDKVYATSGKQSLLYEKSKITKSHDRLLVFDEAKFGKMPDHITEKFKTFSDMALTCSWAPQQSVLSHKALGWFLTHCGQGGCSEGILKAVPMIAYPLFAEQPGTAAHVSVNLDIAYELLEVRTGLGLKPLHRGYHPKGTMEALEEEARFILNDAFKGEGGIRKRKNIEELRNRVRNGVKEDGESSKDLSRFIEEYL